MNALRILFGLLAIAFATQVVPASASDWCRYPYVWREAFPGDHVCVWPDVRSQAWQDNAEAADRVNPDNHDYGPDTCRYGFVWRETRPTDHVCVVPGTRQQAADDNAAAASRYAKTDDAGGSAGGSGGQDATENSNSSQSDTDPNGCCPTSMLVCPLNRTWCQK